MASVVLENVSKAYRRARGAGSLIQTVTSLVARPFSRTPAAETSDRLWALKDVNISVEAGEALGIVGPNGAGKTTILRLLARITRPTAGSVRVRGKVASLIELGAGFHPELTGRENIYLNGSILGLGRAEIRRRLDDIVGFAGLEAFLDTPLKHYSSGMYVRLGFAIAAHVDAGVLLVDEALAVGDLSFQRKCLQTLNRFRAQGKTVLFVSHNLHAVQGLASRAMYIRSGMIRSVGDVGTVLGQYVDDMQDLPSPASGSAGQPEAPRLEPRILDIELIDEAGRRTGAIRLGEALTVRIHFDAPVRVLRPNFGISLWTSEGVRVATCDTTLHGRRPDGIGGKGFAECHFASLPLLPGTYFLRGGIYDGESGWPYDRWGWDRGERIRLVVQTSQRFSRHVVLTGEHGIVYLPASWRWEGHDSPAGEPR